MSFKQKGIINNPNGRPKGSPNVLTRTVREAFALVFNELQQDDDMPYTLVNWAKENPKDFYAIASKLIPVQVEATVHQQTLIIDATGNGPENLIPHQETSRGLLDSPE